MKNLFASYRTRIILVSSSIIASLTSVNKLITLNYHDLYEVYGLFITNFVFSSLCWIIILYTDKRIKRLKKTPVLIFSIAFSSLACFLVISIISTIFYRYFNSFSYHLFGRIIPHNRFMYAGVFKISVLIIAIQTVKYMLDIMMEKQKVMFENEILKREKINAQFESLKQQVNPHFLFNTLNTLKTLVKNHDEHAEEFVIRLSEVYRYVLQTNRSDLVTVNEELEILDAYLFMLKARFENSIEINIQLDESIKMEFHIPPFTLQLLIENAIKHNIVSVSKPLRVYIYNQGDSELTVRNNVQPKKSVEESTGIGLENINKRCLFLSGKEISVVKNESEFIVSLPLIRKL